MNTLLVFAFFVATCAADVSHIVGKEATATIVEAFQDEDPSGSFKNFVKTDNGIFIRSEGRPDGEMEGEYHYVDANGNPVDVTWTAGVNGFIPQGSSILQTPESVLRTLEYNAAHPYKEPTTP